MKHFQLLLSLLFILALSNSLYAQTPRNLRVIFEYNRQQYDLLRSQDILSTVYGSNSSDCLAARIVRIVSSDPNTATHFRRLLARASSPVTIHIHYDNPDRLFEGERVNLAGVGERRVNAIDGRTDRLDWMIQRQFVLRRSASTRVFGPPRTLTEEERQRAERLRQESLTEERNGYRFHVWPQAGNTIHMPHRLDNRPGLEGYGSSSSRLAGLLIHELAHTQDRTVLTRGSYGLDNRHYLSEITTPTAAFIEGWANYNQSLVDGINSSNVFASCSSICRETSRGEYTAVSAPSFSEHLSTEGVSAAIFIGVDSSGNRRQAIMRSFNATNRRSRDTLAVLEHYCQTNSNDSSRLASLVDVVTAFTGSAADFARFGQGGTDYYESRDTLRTAWSEFRSGGGTLDQFVAGLTNNTPSEEGTSTISKQSGPSEGKLGLLGVD